MEIRIRKEDAKQVRNQLIMASVFLLMFVPLLIRLIVALPLIRPTAGNLGFAVVATCLMVLLVAVSGWFWMLSAIHVRRARYNDDQIEIERFFAPRVRFPCDHVVSIKAVTTPSFKAPGYQRGTLVAAGASSFYLPDNLPGASLILDWLNLDGISR